MSGLNARMPADSQFDLVVLGDCNPDLVLTGDEIVPSFGQVERFVDAADLMIGGSGSIVAVRGCTARAPHCAGRDGRG